MKKHQYKAKMLELSQLNELKKANNADNSMVVKNERDLYRELSSLKKGSKLKSTGSQSTRLYGLAKAQKKTYQCALISAWKFICQLGKKIGRDLLNKIEGASIQTNKQKHERFLRMFIWTPIKT